MALTLVGCTTGDLATLLGGGESRTTKYIAVADYDNSRVLLYTVPVSTGQSASIVLGQPDFTSSGSATSATGSDNPVKAMMDASGNLWVAECSNSRVVEYKPPFSNGMAASLVLGQPDMTSSTADVSPTALDCPSGLNFDSSGNLWVSDYDNSRIVRYSPPFSNGMAANLVLGQADLNSDTCATTATGLCYPWEGVVFDSSGNLFIGDYDNCRILEYKPPFSTGMAATLVIGQTDFTSSGCGATASTMDSPLGLAFDASGNLWTGDYTNNRVLEFKPPFATGMSASLVLGQADFTSSGSATTASGMDEPYDVSFDSSGNLYVADYGNSRVLVFSPPFATGMNASKVLGQPDLTSGSCDATAATLCYPAGATAIP